MYGSRCVRMFWSNWSFTWIITLYTFASYINKSGSNNINHIHDNTIYGIINGVERSLSSCLKQKQKQIKLIYLAIIIQNKKKHKWWTYTFHQIHLTTIFFNIKAHTQIHNIKLIHHYFEFNTRSGIAHHLINRILRILYLNHRPRKMFTRATLNSSNLITQKYKTKTIFSLCTTKQLLKKIYVFLPSLQI